MQMEIHTFKILHSYIETIRNNSWRLLQAHNILIHVYVFIDLFSFIVIFLLYRGTFFCCFFLWFVICLSVNVFSVNIFSSAAFLWSTFFPHLTAQFPPCYSACLLFLLFVCLIFFLLECKSHLIIFPLIFLSADTLTHPHNDAGSTTAWHLLTELLWTFHLSPKKEPLKHAVILRCTCVLVTPCILPAETHCNFLAFPCC